MATFREKLFDVALERGLRQSPWSRTVKYQEAEIVVPEWLPKRVGSLTETVKPDAVRESLRRGGAKVGIRLDPHMLHHWYATTLRGDDAAHLRPVRRRERDSRSLGLKPVRGWRGLKAQRPRRPSTFPRVHSPGGAQFRYAG